MNDVHKLDTSTQVFFYEQDFYVLSNFSAFNLRWKGHTFPTSEHAYQAMKFWCLCTPLSDAAFFAVTNAPSAHEAFKIAEREKAHRDPNWDNVKVDVMRALLHAKAQQHEYVRRKLLATGTRELIEDSWRDDYWGWGPARDGQNMLGKLWMEVRAALAECVASQDSSASAEWTRLAKEATAAPWRSGDVLAVTRIAVPALVAEVERLREALRRLGSCEAFKGARALDQDRDEELLARIDFARAALEDGT